MSGPSHVLITGATGGIGSALAQQFAGLHCKLTLIARDPVRLASLADTLRYKGAAVVEVAMPLGRDTDYDALVRHVIDASGPIDILVNNAAVNWFGHFASMPDTDIDALVDTNIAVPIHLSRAVLAGMQKSGRGTIVNIGSVFGSIGFAGFPVYSACKFALRGFSEGLRRELRGSGVRIVYVAPRYTRTAFNNGAVDVMARATKMAMDTPELVAQRIITAIKRQKNETFIGWPERFFAKLNAILPAVVDRGLIGTSRKVLSFAPGRTSGLTLNKENN
jgi:short-subunit dehydrogenase